MTLITVIAVMSGFDKNLTEKIVGTNAHIIIEKLGGIGDYHGLVEKVKREEKVEAISPLVEGPVLITSPYATLAIVLRGINPPEEEKVTALNRYITSGDINFSVKNKIILGQELAKKLGVGMGDKVIIIPSSEKGGRTKGLERNTFTVGALFKSGMYEYDASLAYIHLDKGRELFSTGSSIQALGVKLSDYHQASTIAQGLRERLGQGYQVRSWMEARSNLFTALKMEKTVMFVVVALVIVVATFNIASTLIMMVMEKTKDIAILKTVGASSGQVMAIFTSIGTFIGLIGTIVGVLAGIKLAGSLDTILNLLNRLLGVDLFNPRIYYLDRLPVFISSSDIIIIILCSLGLSMLATVYPAWQAARLNPVEALRYE